MIFSNGLDDMVRDGTKTQTRRLKKDGDCLVNRSSLFSRAFSDTPRRKWTVGKTYAIQSGRGKKGNGRFRITKIRKETLQSITDEDARAEGVQKLYYRCPSQWMPNEALLSFKQLWNSIHKKPGARWEDNPQVWVLDMEYVGSS